MAAMLGSLKQIPDKMEQLTADLKVQTVHDTAGGGAVQVKLNGIGQTQSIQIDPAARDHPQLEQWIAEACNTASNEAKQLYTDSVSQMARDMKINIPGLDGMLAKLTGGA